MILMPQSRRSRPAETGRDLPHTDGSRIVALSGGFRAAIRADRPFTVIGDAGMTAQKQPFAAWVSLLRRLCPGMAERPEPEVPQEPADGSKATVSPVAQSSSTPEVSAPMLEVHAPHQAVHTWKDFLVHIAAIAIGLLLALALERFAEYVHERRQLAEARRELAMEVRENQQKLALNVVEVSRIQQEQSHSGFALTCTYRQREV
jgi:hypothetical protein